MMRRNMVVAVLIFVLALLASSIAWAHGRYQGHGRHHAYPHHSHLHSRAQVRIIIGAPLTGSWYYRRQQPYYIYPYPPIVAAPSSPPVYIERESEQLLNQESTEQQPAAFWYHCNSPQGYYPAVKNCPAGWQVVPALP